MTFRGSYLYLSDIAHLSSKTDSCVHGNGFGHWHLPAIVGNCSDLSVLCSKYPFQTDFISSQMRSVTLTKQECAVKQAILKKKRRKSMRELNLVEKVQDDDVGARPMFNHLSMREAAARDIILTSKRHMSSDNLEEDVVVEEEVSNRGGKRRKTNLQMREMRRKGQLFVDLASDDDDVEIVEVEKEACESGDKNARKGSIERKEEEAFWRRVGLRMVPVSLKKSCKVRLKRISIEKGKEREAVGVRSELNISPKKSTFLHGLQKWPCTGLQAPPGAWPWPLYNIFHCFAFFFII